MNECPSLLRNEVFNLTLLIVFTILIQTRAILHAHLQIKFSEGLSNRVKVDSRAESNMTNSGKLPWTDLTLAFIIALSFDLFC